MLNIFDKLEKLVPGQGPSQHTLAMVQEAEEQMEDVPITESLTVMKSLLSEPHQDDNIEEIPQDQDENQEYLTESVFHTGPDNHEDYGGSPCQATESTQRLDETPKFVEIEEDPVAYQPSLDETVLGVILLSYQEHLHEGRTPLLHYCVRSDLWHAIGPIVRTRSPDINEFDEFGFTALMLAAQLGHIRCIKAICEESQTAVKAVDPQGRTALHIAAVCGQVGAVACLLDRGARWTPCDASTLRCILSRENVSALLRKRCRNFDVPVETSSAVDVAASNRNNTTVSVSSQPFFTYWYPIFHTWFEKHKLYVLPACFMLIAFGTWSWT
eukprot:PhF_6_TR1452/c0_g1_i1/m.2596